jgi:hypothetical protein
MVMQVTGEAGNLVRTTGGAVLKDMQSLKLVELTGGISNKMRRTNCLQM